MKPFRMIHDRRVRSIVQKVPCASILHGTGVHSVKGGDLHDPHPRTISTTLFNVCRMTKANSSLLARPAVTPHRVASFQNVGMEVDDSQQFTVKWQRSQLHLNLSKNSTVLELKHAISSLTEVRFTLEVWCSLGV